MLHSPLDMFFKIVILRIVLNNEIVSASTLSRGPRNLIPRAHGHTIAGFLFFVGEIMHQDRRARTIDTSIIGIVSSGSPPLSIEASRQRPLHSLRTKPQPFWPTPQITPLNSVTPAARLSALLSKRSGDRLTLKELSTLLGYSEKYTSEIFRKYMGLSFSEYLKQLHLDKATTLLKDQNLTIAQIAESVGFSDAFAFSHFFKRAIGCSPSEFRKQQTPEAGLR